MARKLVLNAKRLTKREVRALIDEGAVLRADLSEAMGSALGLDTWTPRGSTSSPANASCSSSTPTTHLSGEKATSGHERHS